MKSSKNNNLMRNISILFGSTLTVLAGTIIAPILPNMVDYFSNTTNVDFLSRMSLTMPALIIAITAPFAGKLIDRIGRKPILLVSLLLYAFAGVLGFFLETLVGILISRALLGLAIAGVMSSLTTLILDYFQGEKLSKFLGYQGAFMGAGGVVFLLVSGYLAEVNWRLPFLLYAFSVFIFFGILFTVKENKKMIAKYQSQVSIQNVAFPYKAVAPVYLIAMFGMLTFFIFPVQLPFYLVDKLNLGSGQIGFVLSLQTMSSVVSALFYFRLKKKMNFHTLFAIIFATFAISQIIIGLGANYTWVVVSMLIAGIGVGFISAHVTAWLDTKIPSNIRGVAVGGMTSFLFIGQFLAPIVSQPIISFIGLEGMFASFSVFSSIIVIIFLVIKENQ